LPNPNTTVAVPLVSSFPAASFVCSVTVVVLPDTNEFDNTLTEDCDKLITPGVTVTLGEVDVTGAPLIVVVIGLLPAIVPVNVAV
jgi:hypothetical protein